MKPIPFIAETAADAAAQIRAQLGPQAVVLNVRQITSGGLARLWSKPRLEVLAYVPDSTANTSSNPDTGSTLHAAGPSTQPAPSVSSPSPESALQPNLDLTSEPAPIPPPNNLRDYHGWRIGPVLEETGLLPFHAQRLVGRLQTLHGEQPPPNLGEEIQYVRAYLRGAWPKAPANLSPASTQTHVFVGAPGVGKTTCLCKWLAQSILLEGRSARVWRLDGRTANTAETVSVFGEILSVPVERSINGTPITEELLMVDLPGVNWREPAALEELSALLTQLASPAVHLVLNAAYELPLLFAHVRAFGVLPVSDLIVTHLDEETKWGKLWNLALGTNYTLRYLSAGQNIPGEFFEASAERLLDNQFHCG